MTGSADHDVNGKRPESSRVDLAKSISVSGAVAEMAKSISASSALAEMAKSISASSIYGRLAAPLGDTRIDEVIKASEKLDPARDYSRRLLEMPEVGARIAESLELATTTESNSMDAKRAVGGDIQEYSGGFTDNDRMVVLLFIFIFLLNVEVWLYLTNRELFDLVNGSAGGLSLAVALLGRRG